MRVNSLITHLQLKKISVMYESAHVAITFQLLEMSSITTSNHTVSNIRTRFIFQRVFLRKISAILPICITQKINLEVSCNRNRVTRSRVNLIHLPNFVNVAAILVTYKFCLYRVDPDRIDWLS